MTRTRAIALAIAVGAGIAVVLTVGCGASEPELSSVPSPEGYWGVAVGPYAREARRRGLPFPPDLREVRQLGATHVLVPVSVGQETVTSSALAPDRDTPSDAELRALFASAERAGLGVVLMPFIVVQRGTDEDWRGALRPSDPDAWWAAYERFILRYAALAARSRVAMYVVGSELTSLTTDADAPRWERLVERVRGVYSGPLAYSANHDALEQLSPFQHVDVAGVSAYFPLADDHRAPPAALYAAWERHAQTLRLLAERVGKPLVVLELGYRSVDGGAVRPWDYTHGAPVDLEEQRAAYAAFVDATHGQSWLRGTFAWMWFGDGGPHDRHYTPRGKPALAELTRLFEAR